MLFLLFTSVFAVRRHLTTASVDWLGTSGSGLCVYTTELSTGCANAMGGYSTFNIPEIGTATACPSGTYPTNCGFSTTITTSLPDFSMIPGGGDYTCPTIEVAWYGQNQAACNSADTSITSTYHFILDGSSTASATSITSLLNIGNTNYVTCAESVVPNCGGVSATNNDVINTLNGVVGPCPATYNRQCTQFGNPQTSFLGTCTMTHTIKAASDQICTDAAAAQSSLNQAASDAQNQASGLLCQDSTSFYAMGNGGTGSTAMSCADAISGGTMGDCTTNPILQQACRTTCQTGTCSASQIGLMVAFIVALVVSY